MAPWRNTHERCQESCASRGSPRVPHVQSRGTSTLEAVHLLRLRHTYKPETQTHNTRPRRVVRSHITTRVGVPYDPHGRNLEDLHHERGASSDYNVYLDPRAEVLLMVGTSGSGHQLSLQERESKDSHPYQHSRYREGTWWWPQ